MRSDKILTSNLTFSVLYCSIGLGLGFLLFISKQVIFSYLPASNPQQLAARDVMYLVLQIGIPLIFVVKAAASMLESKNEQKEQGIEYDALQKMKELEAKLRELQEKQNPMLRKELPDEKQEIGQSSEEAFKQGLKYGLQLALKKGVEFRLKANGSTVIDVDGLKFEVIGTSKEITTDQEDKKQDDDVLEIIGDD
jgi:hypothetical protein